MPEEIVMPRLSDTMEEGTISRWLKREGDTVHKGEAILEVETDKANMELQAYSDGVIQKILHDDGSTVAIGTAVGVLAKPGEQVQPEQAQPEQAATAETAGQAAESPAPQARAAQATGAPVSDAGTPPAPVTVRERPAPEPADSGNGAGGGRIKATPLARSLARQHNIDLSALSGQGSGPGGRIVKLDIEQYLEQQGAVAEVAAAPAAQPQPQEAPAAAAAPAPAPAAEEDVEWIKPNRFQQVSARRLLESKTTIPHFYVTNEVDMAAALELRQQLRATYGDDPKITPTDLIVRACAVALREMPEVNTSWRDGQLARHKRVNVGVAVNIPDGLVVPVIKDADRKSVRELAIEARSLYEKARNGKLTPAEMSGGTFTVSTLGMYDVEEFQAIINPPESGILAVGTIAEKPVAQDGQVVIRPRMRLTLSVDHRVIPGVPAAQFLQLVKKLLQEPLRLGF